MKKKLVLKKEIKKRLEEDLLDLFYFITLFGFISLFVLFF